jgi:RNA polymerase sigma-70 factor (ECF subfamily)
MTKENSSDNNQEDTAKTKEQVLGILEEESILVEQILSGQKDMFRLLIKRYQRKVHAMGLSFFHNREDAADYTQDVFIRLYNSLATFRGDSRFSTWLYRIAYNTAINSLKRRKEYHCLVEEPTTGDGPEHHLLRETAAHAVRLAVAELPEKYRFCIDLYFFYDCSIKEIERITGIPENTIKSHVFRAKKLLKEKLEKDN